MQRGAVAQISSMVLFFLGFTLCFEGPAIPLPAKDSAERHWSMWAFRVVFEEELKVLQTGQTLETMASDPELKPGSLSPLRLDSEAPDFTTNLVFFSAWPDAEVSLLVRSSTAGGGATDLAAEQPADFSSDDDSRGGSGAGSRQGSAAGGSGSESDGLVEAMAAALASAGAPSTAGDETRR